MELFNESFEDFVTTRIGCANVDADTQEYLDMISFPDETTEDLVLSYSAEVERCAYVAGLKDGARLFLKMGGGII